MYLSARGVIVRDDDSNNGEDNEEINPLKLLCFAKMMEWLIQFSVYLNDVIA